MNLLDVFGGGSFALVRPNREQLDKRRSVDCKLTCPLWFEDLCFLFKSDR